MGVARDSSRRVSENALTPHSGEEALTIRRRPVDNREMKVFALGMVFALSLLSTHVAVDHALVAYCHSVSHHDSHTDTDDVHACHHHGEDHSAHRHGADKHEGHCHLEHGFSARILPHGADEYAATPDVLSLRPFDSAAVFVTCEVVSSTNATHPPGIQVFLLNAALLI